MNFVRDPDTVVATWLEEGPTDLPESTRRAILAAIPTTTQRRPIAVLPWRFLPMNRFRLVVLTAALAMGAAGGLYYGYWRANQSVVVPAATPTATAEPTAAVTSLGTATLTDDGCSFEPGAPSAVAGRASVEVVNASGSVGGFDLVRIRPGFSYDDLRAWSDGENERLAEIGLGYNLQPPESGDWQILLWTVKAGESSSIPVAKAGTYGLTCFRHVSNSRTDRIDLVGPIKVTEPGR